MSKKAKKLLCILLSAVLLISLSGCGSSKKSSGSSSKISAKETVAKSTTETATKTSGSSSKSSFSMKASNGQNLEAKVGFMVCFDTVSSAPSCDHNPSVLLPYLGDYVGGISTIHDEISYSSSGYYGTNYSFDGKPDKASVKKYVDALSSYGCTLEYTWGGSGSTTAYYLNCSKKITHGTISLAAREYYDLSVTVYEKEKFVSIYYPKEIWFDYSSLGGGATIVNPIPSGKTKCSSCGGTGREKCHACGGDGLEICPNCKGTGKYYEQTYGQTTGIYRDCKRCKGGHINCSRCVDGTVSCTACGGDGYR